VRHEPERTAAAYLAGDLSRRRKRLFEEHILECEDCWREVEAARRGRAVAEAARELAPQSLRERVRASVASVENESTPRLWPRLTVLVSVALVALVVFALGELRTSQPETIDAILASFAENERIGAPEDATLPRRLGDLDLSSVTIGEIEGMEVVLHSYEDPAGHRVDVYQSSEPFPTAAGAEHSTDGRTWRADSDGLVLFCADEPTPSLVVGDDGRELALAVDRLGLR
jgi:putative zinc finger protein